MDVCEEDREKNCGRYIFREADLAYLLIDGERLFPLAELLASLFSNTARTTLFTRMEKINTRRHFCSAEEIKLLKTVNGIHGSSAICTLIPEADVQKYCAVYIDRTVDVKLFSTSIRRSKVEKDISKTKHSKQSKYGSKKSISTANTSEGKSTTTGDVVSVEAYKSLKRKKACSGAQKFKNGAKVKVPRVAKATHKSNNYNTELLDECYQSEVSGQPNSLATLAKHALNGCRQTPQRRCGVKARKKRKTKHSLEDSFVKGNIRLNKKAKLVDKLKASDIGGSSWRHTTKGADVNASCSSTERDPCGSSLSQCLTNANSEILFSDASSNDSGFASTTISDSFKRNKPPSSFNSNHEKPTQLSLNQTGTLSSPSKQEKYKRFKKTRLEPKEDKAVNQSLSPPALVLKRQNNVWQVETKSEQKDSEPSSNKSIISSKAKAKKRLKWPSRNAEKCKHQQDYPEKTMILKKRKKNKFSGKDEASRAVQLDPPERNLKRNQKIKRKKLHQHCVYKSQANVTDQNVKSNNLVKSVQESKNVKPRRQQLSNNLQKTAKKVGAKTLKASKDFKFITFFSSFPLLSLQDGDLCPRFSEVLPAHCKTPSSSHPIWKWQRGRPVYFPESRKICVT